MASEQITLKFGAENTTGDVIRELNSDIKNFQRGAKDAFKGAGDFDRQDGKGGDL